MLGEEIWSAVNVPVYPKRVQFFMSSCNSLCAWSTVMLEQVLDPLVPFRKIVILQHTKSVDLIVCLHTFVTTVSGRLILYMDVHKPDFGHLV